MNSMKNPYKNTAPSTIYIHVPFCRSKCLYCDFASFVNRDHLHDAYFEALQQEMKVTAGYLKQRNLMRPIRTVYFGGGTPTIVPAHNIAETIVLIRELWGLDEDTEITVECNPGAADSSGLEELRRAGANRLSIGLQAAQDHLLRRIGRIHTVQDFKDTIHAARRAGFSNISVDLMVGLPGQTLNDVAESIQLLGELDIGHLSFYSLIIEEGTPFAEMEKQGKLDDLPDEDTERLMYELVRQEAAAKGLHHYEVSNAGKPGTESQQNLVYWRAEPYLAFGLAAASYVEGVRRLNTDDLTHYIEYYGAGNMEPVQPFAMSVENDEISGEESGREFFLLGFRVLDGINLANYRRIYGEDPDGEVVKSLQELKDKGLVENPGGIPELWRLSRKGLDFANEVFREFV